MGFWDSLGDIVKGVAEATKNKVEDMNEKRKIAEIKLREKDSYELMNIYESPRTNMYDRLAAKKILKERDDVPDFFFDENNE